MFNIVPNSVNYSLVEYSISHNRVGLLRAACNMKKMVLTTRYVPKNNIICNLIPISYFSSLSCAK